MTLGLRSMPVPCWADAHVPEASGLTDPPNKKNLSGVEALGSD